MPSPRDLTGDLARHPRKRLEAAEVRPRTLRAPLRPLAFDPLLWLTGLIFLGAIATQFALMLWML